MEKSAAEGEQRWAGEIQKALPEHGPGARNLAAYLGLRSRELGVLQLELAAVGLSSVGRSAGHVRDTLGRLRAWVEGRPWEALAGSPGTGPDRVEAEARLHAHTRALFGPRPPDRHVYIMVTAPSEPGPVWADGVLQAGATVLRINGSQGDPASWETAARVFRERAARLGLEVRVVVDLPGPKLRIFLPPAEPGVMHVRRRRDRWGKTVEPARVPLRFGPGRPLPEVALPESWRVQSGDELWLHPAQKLAGGRVSGLRVVVRPDGCWGESEESVFVVAGQPVVWTRAGTELGRARVGPLPVQPGECRFNEGDRFFLRDMRDFQSDMCEPGPEQASANSGEPALPVLLLEEAGILEWVGPGERVVLDDGRVLAVVEEKNAGVLLCRVRAVSKPGARLRSGKGVAFPDTSWSQPEHWPGDDAVLRFAVDHADAVGVSFVGNAADVDRVGRHLAGVAGVAGAGGIEGGVAGGGKRLGMIVKLETRAAMAHLEEILFAALRYEPVGLMIARGDLAVELSYERLAEVQEEILTLGEACHVPVIWATQVLESMARSGVPTRAEVTDAAMGMRAECIMLNRGRRMVGAVRLLAGIIRRMEVHQFKRRQMFRRRFGSLPTGPDPPVESEGVTPKNEGPHRA